MDLEIEEERIYKEIKELYLSIINSNNKKAGSGARGSRTENAKVDTTVNTTRQRKEC